MSRWTPPGPGSERRRRDRFRGVGSWQDAPVTAAVIQRALSGDGDAFHELTAPYAAELHRHCYRMLGSLTDADDVLQEVLLAAWQGLSGFAGRSSLRTWLYRIATNRCLNAIRAGHRRPRPEPVPPFDAPAPSRRDAVTWLQPHPAGEWSAPSTAADPAARFEAEEAIRLAFVVALQRMPPRQTAALLLCDVLTFSTAEAAAMLETTSTSVKGLLQRARASLDRDLDPGAEHRPDDDEDALARRFADAFARDDVAAVISLLTDDAWLTMPPAPHEYVGAEAIGSFLRASLSWRVGRGLELLPTRANGQPAFVCALPDDGGPGPRSLGLVVLTMSGGRISRLTRFLDPALADRFS